MMHLFKGFLRSTDADRVIFCSKDVLTLLRYERTSRHLNIAYYDHDLLNIGHILVASIFFQLNKPAAFHQEV